MIDSIRKSGMRLTQKKSLDLAIEEFKNLLKTKAYWFSFLLVFTVGPLLGAFDSDRISAMEVRLFFGYCICIVSIFACAALAGVFRALSGNSALEKMDVVAKIAVIWVLIATLPIRIAFTAVLDVPLTFGELANGIINGLSNAFFVSLVWGLTQFGEVFLYGKQGPRVFANPRQHVPDYIESEDHYLKMVSRNDVKIMRANLGNAAENLGEAGFRCHKSYWVSHGAIKDRRRLGRQLFLVLNDGTEIPVGRSFEKQVRSIMGSGKSFANAEA